MTEMFNISVFRDGREVSNVGGDVEGWLDWSLNFVDSYNPDMIKIRFYTI